MNDATDFDRQRSDIETASERFVALRPFLEPILRPYTAICLEKINLAEKLDGQKLALPAMTDRNRCDQGLALVNSENATGLKAALDVCWPDMITAFKRHLPVLEAALDRLQTLPRESDLGQLAMAFLRGEAAAVKKIARARGVAPGLVNLVLHGVLGPVLAWIARTARVAAGDCSSRNGTCPVCGALPGLSALSPAGDLGSEFLSGGGGQRWLHCALCGFAWRVPRGLCPACGNQDHEKRRIFQAEGETGGERLEICLACNAYLPCIDLRESPSPMPPEIAGVGMLHLDAWASENGYHPLMETPWNQLR